LEAEAVAADAGTRAVLEYRKRLLEDLQGQVEQRRRCQSQPAAAAREAEQTAASGSGAVLRTGQHVRLTGFDRPEMNDLFGTLGKRHESGDWQVFVGGVAKRISPQHLEPAAAVPPAAASEVAAQSAVAGGPVPPAAEAEESAPTAVAVGGPSPQAAVAKAEGAAPKAAPLPRAAAAGATEQTVAGRRTPSELRRLIAEKEEGARRAASLFASFKKQAGELKVLLQDAEAAEAEEALRARREYDELLRRTGELREKYGFGLSGEKD